MPGTNDQTVTATTTASPTPQEQLAQLIEKIKAARPEEIGELFRQYVNLFLDMANHPEKGASQTAKDELAQQISSSFSSFLVSSSPDATRAIALAQLNALEAKQENPSTDPTKKNISTGADPVMMFNGQFVHESEDIRINGAGIDFVFKRTYKNQSNWDGPLGFNWDHNYNLRLRVANDTIFRSTGALGEEAYVRNPNDFFAPPDGQHGIVIENYTLEQDVSFIWRAPGGIRYLYQESSAYPDVHRIKRIEDKHGNDLRFMYDPLDHLSMIILNDPNPNNPNRIIQFTYDEQDRIVLIRDYTREFGRNGRQWRYSYDDLGDLIAVTSPSTPRYRAGLTTCYEYSSALFTGDLQHNLTRIIDPAGQIYLENEYGIERGPLSFNRVVRQRQGGGESYFEYEDIVQEFDFDYPDKQRPAYQTTMVERNGQPVHYIYNKFGNLLLREEDILENGLSRRIQWHYGYNADGALLGVLSPDGTVIQYHYGREDYLRLRGIADEEVQTDAQLTPQVRMTFGNLLAVVKRGRRYDSALLNLSRGAWRDFFPDIFSYNRSQSRIDDIITKFTYEPDYQQLLTSSDPRYTQSADPHALESSRYRETLTTYRYSGPPANPVMNRYLFLRRVEYPNTRLPDGTLLTNIVQHFTVYDNKGRLLQSIDPEGIVTALEYFDAPTEVKAGYLKRKTIDPTTLAITTGYEVNEIGITTTIIQPRAAGAPLDRFRTFFEVNSLNQIVRTRNSAPFSYETRSFYDRNGQLERVERDIKDENGYVLAGGVEVKRYRYDEQNNLIQESIGGEDVAAHLITRHRYDESDKRVRTIFPKGNEVRRKYDERLLETRVIRGSGSAEASTTRTEYSGDGLKVKNVDGRGNVTRYRYDPFNRLIETVDPLGNISLKDYDKAGNLLVERFFQQQSDGTFLLLTRSEYEYDELNRRIVEQKNLFQIAPVATQPETNFLASPGPGTLVQTKFFHDRKGRLVKVINGKGQETEFEYDAMDRKVGERDAMGNYTRLFYDAHGNLTRRDLHEQVTDPNTGAVLREDVFSTLHSYDELDRLVLTTDSLGNTTRFTYDSRNSLIREVDPLGNVKRFEYDVHGRQVCVLAETTQTGLGGGGPLQSVITRFEYDQNGNLLATIDAKGNRTEREFDALDRRSFIRYPDTTTQVFGYDRDDHITLLKDNNGLKRQYAFDALGYMRRMDLDASALAAGVSVEQPPNFEEFEYDGLGRVNLERNDFCETQKKVDSLGRIYEETLTFNTPLAPLAGILTIARQFDALGNPVEITYPSGRAIRYQLDDLNRITRVENLRKGSNYPGSTALPDSYEILRNEYRGLRKGRTLFGNGASTTYGFDQNARIIEISHLASNDSLAIQQLYDAAGNMRFKNDVTPSGNRSEDYTYDSLYRLTKFSESTRTSFNSLNFQPSSIPLPANQLDGQTRIDAVIGSLAQDPTNFTFRYDALGNREEERQPGQPPISYIPNNLNQYASVGAYTLRYDLNGNVTEDGLRQYVYDYRNQLARVSDTSTAQTTQFFCDARGRRILSLVAGRATHFVLDGQNVIEEYRDGLLLAQYVSENEVDTLCQIAVKEAPSQGNEYWYHKDLVRSSRRLTDALGNMRGRYDYSAFGILRESVGPHNPYKFMGRYFDESIAAYNFRSREYSLALGRFMQRDIITAPNLYVFLENNPLAAIDPIGRERQPVSSNRVEATALVDYLADPDYRDFYNRWKSMYEMEVVRERENRFVQTTAAYLEAYTTYAWREWRNNLISAGVGFAIGRSLSLASRLIFREVESVSVGAGAAGLREAPLTSIIIQAEPSAQTAGIVAPEVSTVTTTTARLGSLAQAAESGPIHWIAGDLNLFSAYSEAMASSKSAAVGRAGFNLLRSRMATRISLGGPIHHWRFPIQQFQSEAMAAENLYLIDAPSLHLQIHQAVGLSGAPYRGMMWGQQTELQSMFNFWSSGQKLSDVMRLLP